MSHPETVRLPPPWTDTDTAGGGTPVLMAGDVASRRVT